VILLLGCANPPSPADTGTAQVPLGLATVALEPGTFTMGSPAAEPGHQDDELQVEVTLSRPFELTTYEITRATWMALTGAEPGGDPDCGDDCAATGISWHAAAAFTNTLSATLGLPPCYSCDDNTCEAPADVYACEGARLPTEAEWEYAARAGSSASFWTGADLVPGTETTCDGNVLLSDGTLLDELGWYCGNSGGGSVSTGGKQPNAWGLHDMVGGVYEWVHDGHDDYTGGDDPQGSASSNRVHRGGSWGSVPSNLRAARRTAGDANYEIGGLGLRVARTLSLR